ncbi:MAG: transaldolase family protein [Thermodesulfobacteriota bacterium]
MNTHEFKSPLHKMVCTSITDLWNDSCSVEELKYAIAHGAVGATSNPVIVGEVLGKEMHLWKDRIRQLVQENPTATDDEITWQLIGEISAKGAALLIPIFEREGGRKGRLSIQIDPKCYRDPERMVRQAVHFDRLAPNIIVKIPVTRAGVEAIAEATYRGVSINATICFSVPQAVAVAEAVEKGLTRRQKEGKDISRMGPVCTIMVGRLDDWLKGLANRDDIITTPPCLEWAGVAVMKKAYEIYKARGYRLRLLSAATRNHMHWSEFIGGDVVITLTHQWQRRFNGCDVAVEPRMDRPVDPEMVNELRDKFSDFRRAYEIDGMAADDFDTFGPTVKTLRQFIGGYESLVATIRDMMLPNPDTKKDL